MAFICQRLAYSNVSVVRVTILGLLSLSLERIYYQWLLFNKCCKKDESRVFVTSISSSADNAHWYVQVERNGFDIRKEGGRVRGVMVGNKPDDGSPRTLSTDIPSSLSETLYVPFLQYVWLNPHSVFMLMSPDMVLLEFVNSQLTSNMNR
jgi:hypothetical protein